MVNAADILFTEDVAVIDAFVADVTDEVDTANVAVLWPDGIVTEDGTMAAAELLVRFTGTPLVGAGASNVIVPVAL